MFLAMPEDGPVGGTSWPIAPGTTEVVVRAADGSEHLYRGDADGLYVGGQVLNHVREVTPAPPRKPYVVWPRGAEPCWRCEAASGTEGLGLCGPCYAWMVED